MNRKIALSSLSILGALLVMGGATFAAFSDSATANSNTFASGTATLQLATDNGTGPNTFGDSITGPNFSGILPGQSRTFSFWLKNNSTEPMGMNVTADITAIVNSDDAADQLDNALLVSWTCDVSGNNSLDGETPTGSFSPRDWFVGGNASLFLNLPAGAQRFCQMTGTLPASADNTVAGETVVFDVTYDGAQVIPSPSP